MCNYLFIWAVCIHDLTLNVFLYMREKYEETIISLSIICSNLAASVNAVHSGTLKEEGCAHALNMFM